MDPELQALIRAYIRENPVLTEAEEEAYIKRQLQVGIPPASMGPSVELRSYPRSLDHNGHAITTTPKTLNFQGPFGPVVAMYVDNRSTTAEIILIGADQSSGVRIGCEKRRRIEFDTPTDSSGRRIDQLTWTLVATAIDAATKVFLEVE